MTATIHPFPARMAPDLVHDALQDVPAGGIVLDPMCGSGTVPRLAAEAGHDCVGVDLDPLAILMARAWTSHLDPIAIFADAEEIVQAAKSLSSEHLQLPEDPETRTFLGFWFAAKQKAALARLSAAIMKFSGQSKNALWVAMSRIIVSKEMMASLARDTSHSRPHKVAEKNDFDVYSGFLKSARVVARRLQPERLRGKVDIILGDARNLRCLNNNKFDLVLTSPPYLNAIDYLRGHRLSLVWMGHHLGPLRATRGSSVGAERILPHKSHFPDLAPFIRKDDGSTLGPRHIGWIRRYASDMQAIIRQIRRKVKTKGRVVMVLGNSFLRGARINNAGLIEVLAGQNGFRVHNRRTREIAARRRYLPPPGQGTASLDTRMRTETVLTFVPS